MDSQTKLCECCKREVDLTKHHLIPAKYHTNKKFRKKYELDFMKKNVAWVCRPCHDQIHTVFIEKELAEDYNTIYNIVEHEEIKKWIGFIEKQPADFKPKVVRGPRR